MQLHLDQPLAHWLPLPSDLPFTRREALAHGLTDRDLRRLVEQGLLRRPLRGVFVDARLPDTLDLRVATLTKVMPEGCFVADRTAGWLHGANMILAPNDRSEEHTSELQSLMRISYAVFCLKKKKKKITPEH